MTARILFVDDEPHILETMVGLWGGMYDVETALDGRAGLAAIARQEPDLIVSDMRMPGMDGAQFLAASREAAPSAVRMLFTAETDVGVAARVVNESGIFRLLAKPSSKQAMAAAFGDALIHRAEQQRQRAIATQLVHAERLATLGTMSAMLGHEMNNALSLLGCAIEAIELDAVAGRPPHAESVQLLVLGRERLMAQARSATSLARRSTKTLQRHDLGEVISDLLAAVRSAGLGKRAEIALQIDCDAIVLADRTELEQMMLNLVKNAMDAIGDQQGRVAIHVRVEDGFAKATVTDSGPGIAESDLARVFEPYYTTKPVGVGTGLGLPVSQQLAQGYGGAIELRSAPGEGTRATLALPVARHRRHTRF